jgi:TolB protein
MTIVAARSMAIFLLLSALHACQQSPDFHPMAGKVVYLSAQDGMPEMYLMDLDGSNQKRITFSEAIESNPKWTEDGEQIIFQSTASSSKRAYSYHPGTEKIEIYQGQGFPDPSGKHLVVEKYADAKPNLFIQDESGERQLTSNTEFGLLSFADWSADGKKVLYTAGNRFSELDIFELDVASGEQTKLSSRKAAYSDLSYAPDLKYVCYEAPQNNEQRVYILNLKSKEETMLLPRKAVHPSWTPSGDVILEIIGRGGIFELSRVSKKGEILQKIMVSPQSLQPSVNTALAKN